MAPAASPLIYLTMGSVADYLLGNGQPDPAMHVLGKLFHSGGNVFSYQLAEVNIVDRMPAGLLLSAPWQAMQGLRLSTAYHVARIAGLASLLRLMTRSAPLARAKEAEDDDYFVAHLAVAPGFRGRGLGTVLMAHAEAAARRHALRNLALTVATDNVAAISFYRGLGFKIVGTARFPSLEERIGYAGFHRMRKSVI
jgi:ribosomal protein S18 acetylase RimI-like enzyme